MSDLTGFPMGGKGQPNVRKPSPPVTVGEAVSALKRQTYHRPLSEADNAHDVINKRALNVVYFVEYVEEKLDSPIKLLATAPWVICESRDISEDGTWIKNLDEDCFGTFQGPSMSEKAQSTVLTFGDLESMFLAAKSACHKRYDKTKGKCDKACPAFDS